MRLRSGIGPVTRLKVQICTSTGVRFEKTLGKVWVNRLPGLQRGFVQDLFDSAHAERTKVVFHAANRIGARQEHELDRKAPVGPS